MNLADKIKKIKKGELSAVDNVMQFSKKIATKETKDLNIFLHLNEKAIAEAKEIDARIKEGEKVGKLAGTCFALKSNILYQGMTANCGSKVLENFVAPFHATVVHKLLAQDAIFLGYVNMDEFACGASGETSAFGPTKNPTNPTLIPGGSSSGSAAAVAAELCDFTLGSDTGGSIRNPASHCGIVGLKPSYGKVSRYGLIDMCMSFDCIGPLTQSVDDAKLVLSVIGGQDNFDATTSDVKNDGEEKGVLGVVKVTNHAQKEIGEEFSKTVRGFAEKLGWKIKEIELPLDIAIETYYVLVYTEFFSGTRKFDGRRFGLSIDEFGGPEVQRRIIGGSMVTQAEFEGKYYREALKAQNFIKREFEKIFSSCDAVVLPTVPKLAHEIGESISVEEMYAYDVFTALANIAHLPAISVPMGDINGKKVGLQIMTPRYAEDFLCKLAKDFEEHARS